MKTERWGRGWVHLAGNSRVRVSGPQIMSIFLPSLLPLFLSLFILAHPPPVGLSGLSMGPVKIAPKKTLLSHHECGFRAEMVIRRRGRKTFWAAQSDSDHTHRRSPSCWDPSEHPGGQPGEQHPPTSQEPKYPSLPLPAAMRASPLPQFTFCTDTRHTPRRWSISLSDTSAHSFYASMCCSTETQPSSCETVTSAKFILFFSQTFMCLKP